ncbi:hypothetical protein HHI36_002801 [Cryptolaemus montrouzieri]|uniref:Uncharacterized protein n=1 Tax=Cryptolaemus montrouzieri TaxID=559131 RepID=A0ABD2PC58_9CUCU
MELNVQKLLLRCCMKVEVNKNELICAVAVEFLNNSDSVKYLVILAVYLIQNLNHRSGNQLVENSFIDYDTGTVDKSSGRFLKLAFDLMDKALDIADYEEFSACLKIYIWVDSIYFLKRYNSEVDQNMEIYENTFDIENLNPSYQSLLAIQKIFNIFTSFITQFETEDSRFLTYFQKGQDEVSQDDLLNEIKDFRRLSYTLTQEGESFLAYKLLGTLQNQLMVHKDLDPQINSLLAEIIKKIVFLI